MVKFKKRKKNSIWETVKKEPNLVNGLIVKDYN